MLTVNFRGPPRTFKTILVYQVVNGETSPDFSKEKIVLIGATTETLHDTYPTPFRGDVQPMSGVEIGANAIETLLTNDYLFRVSPLATFALILFASLAGLALHRARRPLVALGGLVGLMLAYALLWEAAFIVGKTELPLIAPQAALFLAFVAPTVERAAAEESEKRRVRSIFERFISPEMVEQLVERGIADSRGKRAELTILFADIRGFTTLAEKLAPERVAEILNEYLAAMIEVIFQHGVRLINSRGTRSAPSGARRRPNPSTRKKRCAPRSPCARNSRVCATAGERATIRPKLKSESD